MQKGASEPSPVSLSLSSLASLRPGPRPPRASRSHFISTNSGDSFVPGVNSRAGACRLEKGAEGLAGAEGGTREAGSGRSRKPSPSPRAAETEEFGEGSAAPDGPTGDGEAGESMVSSERVGLHQFL